MIVKSRYNGIYERIIRSKDGRLVRLQFVVAEIDGKLKGQIISAEPIFEVHGKAETQYFFPTSVNKEEPKNIIRTISATSRISPFSSFEFFMSQPTRAPSFA